MAFPSYSVALKETNKKGFYVFTIHVRLTKISNIWRKQAIFFKCLVRRLQDPSFNIVTTLYTPTYTVKQGHAMIKHLSL